MKKINTIFGNTYPLWRVKTGTTVVTSAAETTSHGVLRRIESWNSSELGWYPSRSFPLLCEVFLGEWKRDALPDREIFHAHRTSPHLYPPILSDHSYLMRVSVYLPLPLFTLELPRLGQTPTDVLLLVLRRKRYREEIKSFFSIKKTVLLVVRPHNCETFAPAELIKSFSIGALY